MQMYYVHYVSKSIKPLNFSDEYSNINILLLYLHQHYTMLLCIWSFDLRDSVLLVPKRKKKHNRRTRFAEMLVWDISFDF